MGLSAVVFAERDGKILILKRAMGEATGAWYLPGGAVDPGEDVETAARRELMEESGLTPSGPLELVASTELFAYGANVLQLGYACDCLDGEPVVSAEHSGARWIEPVAYRDRYLSDDVIAAVTGRDAHTGALIAAARRQFDAYLRWRDERDALRKLRNYRLTAEMYLFRGDEILLLKRRGGVGDGVWYLPGGIVEPREDPLDAAVRETLEETGLHAKGVQLLRVWSFPDPAGGHDVFHAMYAGVAADGEVRISDEHSDFAWMTPDAYCARYWNEAVERAVPQWAAWMSQVRRNCATAAAWAAGAGIGADR